MNMLFRKTVLAALIGYAGGAAAFTFETESVSGSFDSTVILGFGVRARDRPCTRGVAGASGSGGPAG